MESRATIEADRENWKVVIIIIAIMRSNGRAVRKAKGIIWSGTGGVYGIHDRKLTSTQLDTKDESPRGNRNGDVYGGPRVARIRGSIHENPSVTIWTEKWNELTSGKIPAAFMENKAKPEFSISAAENIPAIDWRKRWDLPPAAV